VRPHSADDGVTETARRAHPALDRRANPQYVLPLRPRHPERGGPSTPPMAPASAGVYASPWHARERAEGRRSGARRRGLGG
jgi:hypothetical protein